jgi:hypothetical protein
MLRFADKARRSLDDNFSGGAHAVQYGAGQLNVGRGEG